MSTEPAARSRRMGRLSPRRTWFTARTLPPAPAQPAGPPRRSAISAIRTGTRALGEWRIMCQVEDGIRYELLRHAGSDGLDTTVYVVRHPRQRTRIGVLHFDPPERLDEWC